MGNLGKPIETVIITQPQKAEPFEVKPVTAPVREPELVPAR